jgi:hypothetical protein
MPVAGGPNTLGENNLVFAYDTGDVSNSYRGQPTVNVLPSSNVLLTSYNDHGGTHVTDTGFTLFGNATLRNTSNPAQDWNGVYLTGLSSILTPGVTYTYSFYIYFTSDNTTITYFGYGAPYFTGVKGQWNRVSTTFTATTQDYFYVTLQYSNGQPVSTYYLANLQIEQKSYPTQFVNGTRSATQGLLPVIGNSTLDLTNVSFNSNAQMVFDGTNDTISLASNIQSGFTQASYEFICTPTSLPSLGDYKQLYIQENSTWMALYNVGGIPFFGIDLNNGSGWFDGNGGHTTGARTTATITANTTYHVLYSWNGSTVSIYLNGILQSTTSTLQASNGRQNVTTLGAGTTPRNIGSRGSGNFWAGNMDVVKFYNRALTASEVKQNYQQYKTRFNLS